MTTTNPTTRAKAPLILALGLAITAVGLILTTNSPAHAADPNADTRPCVAAREFNSLTTIESRTHLEARWEVTGLGTPLNVPGMGRVITYPRCDPRFPGEWYGIAYTKNRLAAAKVWDDNPPDGQ